MVISHNELWCGNQLIICCLKKLLKYIILTFSNDYTFEIQARCQIVSEKVNDDNDEVSALLESDMLLVQSKICASAICLN